MQERKNRDRKVAENCGCGSVEKRNFSELFDTAQSKINERKLTKWLQSCRFPAQHNSGRDPGVVQEYHKHSSNNLPEV